jgi:hypothetical protein
VLPNKKPGKRWLRLIETYNQYSFNISVIKSETRAPSGQGLPGSEPVNP